ncbi:MAG: hypothetical protein RIT42_820, partial [Bacteroidota bacterium]
SGICILPIQQSKGKMSRSTLDHYNLLVSNHRENGIEIILVALAA